MVEDVVSLLSDLVKIPSVCGDESRIASFIADWLRRNGVSAELMDVEPGRPNVVASLKGETSGPRIMLNGHMDTVEPGRGWTHDPYGAESRDGRMYGRGTIDMKSGLACILWATATARQESLVKRGELIVAAVVDEEAIDRGTYSLVRKGLSNGLDFALISEATDLSVVTAHRGRAVFDVEVHGRAAHSHWPDHGVNAIENAAILLNALPKLNNPIHPRLGNCTVNTLKIEGGQNQVMLVPDRCHVLLDRCLVPGYTSKQALADLIDLINDLGIDATAKLVDRETPFCEPFEISDNNPHVQSVVKAASYVLRKTPRLSSHEGPCDSCIMVSEGKVPTIEFGPTGGKLHESDEFVEIESVRQTAEVYVEILRETFHEN